MKRILFIIIAIVAALAVISAFANKAKGGENSSIILSQQTTTNSNPDVIRTRTGVRPVEAILHHGLGLEFIFYIPHGPVSIFVMNSCGQIVCSYSCNTNEESIVNMPVTFSTGFYYIRIESEAYIYTGDFSI